MEAHWQQLHLTRPLTIVGGDRERLAVTRRGRGKTVCARGAWVALLGGPSTSPLGAMPKLTTLTALSIGFCAGFLCVLFITSTLRLLFATLGKSDGTPPPFAPKRTLWALPLLLLQPGVWVLLAVPYLCYLAYSGRISTTWGWAVVGFVLSIGYMSGLVFLARRRARRKRAVCCRVGLRSS
jgi:hypothetical protein